MKMTHELGSFQKQRRRQKLRNTTDCQYLQKTEVKPRDNVIAAG